MTACTQPGCTGRIIDGYCDVCGSPAGAAPLLPAESAASVVSAAPAVEAGLTGVGRGSGASAGPSNGLISTCTQPGCTGTIVDGYCDVCGSPAGAAPLLPAESTASVASPAPAVEAGLTGVGRGSGASARPSNGLISACTQPGCTGTIVDGYCDVCGSPASAAPFVTAGAAASPASPAPGDEPSLTAAVPASTPAPAPVDEGIPTLFDLRWSPETSGLDRHSGGTRSDTAEVD